MNGPEHVVTGLLRFWRDVDLDRPQIGARIWRTGAEVRLGRRVYRARWTL